MPFASLLALLLIVLGDFEYADCGMRVCKSILISSALIIFYKIVSKNKVFGNMHEFIES